MKQVYVTYKQNGLLKKAVLNEAKYKELSGNTQVEELVVYPSKLLMEQNYSIKCSDGKCNTKTFLND